MADFLKRLAEASIVIGAVLFTTGWSYLYGFYESFGIHVGDLEIDATSAVLFAMPVLRSQLALVIVAAALLVAVGSEFISDRYLAAHKRSLWPFYVVAFSSFLWFMSKAGIAAGQKSAQIDMSARTTHTATVELTSDDPKYDEAEGAACRLSDDYHYLVSTRHSVIVFKAIDAEPSDMSGSLEVCAFPIEKISKIRILRGL